MILSKQMVSDARRERGDGRPMVLAVDDQPEILSALKRVLRDEPYDFLTTSSPREALDWVAKGGIHLLIADERMPDMRGTDLLEEVRRRSPATVRVILTGFPGSATLPYGLAHSVEWLISKPWNDEALRLTIRQLLEDRTLAEDVPEEGSPAPSRASESEGRGRTVDLRKANEELIREIADRKRAEEILRLSEVKFRLLVDGVKDYAIFMLSTEGLIVSWNVGAQRIYGYAAEEILGHAFTRLYPPDSSAKAMSGAFLASVAEEDRAEDEGWRIRKDGSRFWCHSILTAVRDSAGTLMGFSKVTRDLTEQRKAEEERARLNAQMLQGQKLQAIGQLSAGIAHEINNPVGYILSNLGTMAEYCEDLRRLLEPAAEAARALEEGRDPSEALGRSARIQKEVRGDEMIRDLREVVSDCKLGIERIRDIVRSLREFSHVDEGELKPADLNKCLEDALRICWNELKYKAEIEKDYGPLPLVPCYVQRLGQVFINLLVNAGQAIDKRGKVRLSTTLEGDEAVIRVADTGCGISPENLRKIFEPFFTTKPVGSGTGLGLHVAYKIVTAHGGRIEVRSRLGEGSEFTVRLPLAGPKSAHC